MSGALFFVLVVACLTFPPVGIPLLLIIGLMNWPKDSTD